MRRLLAARGGTSVMASKTGRKKKTIGRPQPEKLYYSGKTLSNNNFPHRVAQKTTNSAETSSASACSSANQPSCPPPQRQFGGGEGGYSDEEDQPADFEDAFNDVMRYRSSSSAAGPSKPSAFRNSEEENGDEDDEDDFDYSRAPMAISR